MKYKHIFFDLDRTLWDFDQNMRQTLVELYEKYNLVEAFHEYKNFHNSFVFHNERLWEWYRKGQLDKNILRFKRFELTLKDGGIKNVFLAKKMGEEYIAESPKKTILIPHTLEVLDYLHSRYQLHIITNGFNEVQFTKLKLCGIERFFTKVVTSEIAGHHKPVAGAFDYALRVANASKNESLMIGDDLEIDIKGAREFGMDQVYFNPTATPHQVSVTLEIKELKELMVLF